MVFNGEHSAHVKRRGLPPAAAAAADCGGPVMALLRVTTQLQGCPQAPFRSSTRCRHGRPVLTRQHAPHLLQLPLLPWRQLLEVSTATPAPKDTTTAPPPPTHFTAKDGSACNGINQEDAIPGLGEKTVRAKSQLLDIRHYGELIKSRVGRSTL